VVVVPDPAPVDSGSAQALCLSHPTVRAAVLRCMRHLSSVGCSPRHLSRLFVRYTGSGAAAYRMALRANEVLDALADGHGSLTDLAAVTGFADHAHLTRTIRRRYGATPTGLREALGSSMTSAAWTSIARS
jgi:AraC-like DNA-binding protein